MLVLARRVGEEIVIDGDIILTVVAVKGDTVRLGITAPASVRVDRREVHLRRAAFADVEERLQPLPESADEPKRYFPGARSRCSPSCLR
jgi:carbon storage regulator